MYMKYMYIYYILYIFIFTFVFLFFRWLLIPRGGGKLPPPLGEEDKGIEPL